MKKTKLLLPIGLSTLAGAMIPLVGCSWIIIKPAPHPEPHPEVDKINDDNVTKQYADKKAEFDATHTLTISGYETTLSISDLEVEITNCSIADVDISAKIVSDESNNNTFSVEIKTKDITDNMTLAFNLKFTNKNDESWTGYVSSEYSISYLKNSCWDDGSEAIIVDGGEIYKAETLDGSGICGTSADYITCKDSDGKTKEFDHAAFNKQLYINPSLPSIGNSFLYRCRAFNQPLTLPDSVTSIGNKFMGSCVKFNQPLTIPNRVISIGNEFLSLCTEFNQELTLHSGVTSIGDNFLNSCTKFSQPLTIPNSVTSIKNHFMENCTSFNEPLTLSNNATSIGDLFLCGCASFNQLLTLPNNVKSIRDCFLQNCKAFNQPLILPNSLEGIGVQFMFECVNMTSTVNIQDLQADVFTADTYTLATSDETAAMWETGVTIQGTHKVDFLTAFPTGSWVDAYSNSFYRRLK